MKRWLAFDIGCIECGEPSAVIGVYDTETEASDAASRARGVQEAGWRGQHSFEVFDLSARQPVEPSPQGVPDMAGGDRTPPAVTPNNETSPT